MVETTLPLSARLDLLAADLREYAVAVPDAYQAEARGFASRVAIAKALALALEGDLVAVSKHRDDHAKASAIYRDSWRTTRADLAWLKARIETLQGMLIGHRAVRGVVLAGRAPNVVTRP
jgi:hypothetical protein